LWLLVLAALLPVIGLAPWTGWICLMSAIQHLELCEKTTARKAIELPPIRRIP
jgi:hypothetical protein